MGADYTSLPADLPAPVDDGTADGRIVKVFYPVFPPDRDAGEVPAWLGGRGVGADAPAGPPAGASELRGLYDPQSSEAPGGGG